MAIPTYEQFIPPLFALLAAHGEGVSNKVAHEQLAVLLGLTVEEQEHLLPSGRQRTFHNRIGWAQSYMKGAGLSESPKRGLWRLTDAGRALHAKRPKGLSAEDVQGILSHIKGASSELSLAEAPVVRIGPEEQIDTSVAEIEQAVVNDLLELIGQATPEFFEGLVLDLLHAVGYGVSRADLQTTGGSGDGGIDGIISLDKLGLDKVYVQAKRWQGTVGRPIIQAFFGALAGQRATKGVFITTSDFSQEAIRYAGSVSGSLVLVNGNRLARLMIEHGVGVSVTRTIRLVRVDGDYFAP